MFSYPSRQQAGLQTTGRALTKLPVWQLCGLWITLCVTSNFALYAAEPQPSSLRQLSEFGDVGSKQLAETKGWTTEPGVTVVAHDGKSVIVQVPPLTGLRIERPIRLADGDSLTYWGTHPAITLDSQIIGGSSSYLDYLQLPVAKGKDQRFYLPTVRGIHPGQFLNLHGGPGSGGGVNRGVVKSLGYDSEKRLHDFVADTDLDHVTGATPEADADDAVFLEMSWLMNRATSDKTPDGFTVTFDQAAPEKGTLDWMLVK